MVSELDTKDIHFWSWDSLSVLIIVFVSIGSAILITDYCSHYAVVLSKNWQ